MPTPTGRGGGGQRRRGCCCSYGRRRRGRRGGDAPACALHLRSTSNPVVKRCVKLRTGSASVREESGLCVLTSELALLDARRAAGACGVGIELLFVSEELRRDDAAGERRDDDDDDDDSDVGGGDARLIRDGCREELHELVQSARQLAFASPNVLKKVAGLETVKRDSVVAIVDMPPRVSRGALVEEWGEDVRRMLVLDSVQDPGNVGALLRAAAAFGFRHCALLAGCCDAFNDKCVRAGRGAQWKLEPIAAGVDWDDLHRVVLVNELRLVAADARGTEVRHLGRPRADAAGVCLVLGSEGQGLSQATREQPGLDLVSIAMDPAVESLNVACAGSVLMHELR